MDPAIPRALLWGSLFALPTAVLTQYHLPTAAALAAAGCLLAIFGRARWRWSGLCALPVLLAALHPPVPPRVWPRPGPVVIQGTVTDQSRMPATGETLVLLGSGPNGLRLHCTGPLDLLFGDRIRVTAHLSPTVAPGLLPTLRAPAAAIHKVEGPASAPRLAMAARSALERQLLRLVPGENGALLATLALGRGTRTSADLTQAHRATGLSHLLAVSGAHAVMLGWLLGLGGRRRSQLAAGRLRTGLALAVLFAYALITGSEPPVLRAILAFGLGALATTLGRPLSLASGLLPPALLTAMMSPEALVGPSFLLSYAAVIGLSLASTRGTSRAERYLWSPLRASFWATLATAPITLFWFGQLAPWTVLLTPLLAPLVGVLLLGSLLAAALGCLIPGANAPFGPVLDHLASLYTGFVRTADLLPGTPIQAPFVPPTWALVLAGAMALGVIERLRNRRSLCYNAGVVGTSGFGQGLLVGYVLTAPETADQARDALRQEMISLAESPVPAEEWERARSELAGGLVIGSQANASRVSRAQRDIMYGRGTEELSDLVAQVRACAASELRDAAAKYLHADVGVDVTIGPA